VAFVLMIFLFLLREGVPAFAEVTPANLAGTRWYPTFSLYGILPLLAGSLLVTVVAVAIALPLGVATAVFIREGGSIPVVSTFKRVLGIPTVLMGFGLSDDNLHSPNEKFYLPNFYRGIQASIHFLAELAEA
jgi:phosphate transport system permease protein